MPKKVLWSEENWEGKALARKFLELHKTDMTSMGWKISTG